MSMVKISMNTFFANTLFCCKYRIYKNILKLLYKDISIFYQICNFCITKLLDQIHSMSLLDAKRIEHYHNNFVKMTDELQNVVAGMFSQLKESPTYLVHFYKVFFYSCRIA